MRGALKDLRASPVVWGAVWLALVVSQTVMCSIVAARSAIDLSYHGPDKGLSSSLSGPIIAFSIIMAVFVMLWVVTAAFNQQRRQLALLALQGATPIQLLVRNLLVIVVLFVLAVVVSCLLTPMVAPYLFSLMTKAFSLSLAYRSDHLLQSLGIGLLIAAATVLVGTVLTIRSLSKIRPIEALHQSQDPPKHVSIFRMLLGIALFAGSLCMLIIPGAATSRLKLADLSNTGGRNPIESKATGFIGFSIGGMFLLVFALAVLAPYIVRCFTYVWTHLIPIPSSTWKLARAQAVGRIDRQSTTIIPVTAGLALFMTFSGVLQTLTDSLKKFSSMEHSMSVNPNLLTNLMALLGPALFIAIAGAIAGLLITARSRSLDLALTYVSGAQIGQLRALGTLDGVITMVTATLLAFVVTLGSTASTAFMLKRYLGFSRLSVQWGYWAVAVLLTAAVGAIATGAQACVTRYQNSVRIISQVIGE